MMCVYVCLSVSPPGGHREAVKGRRLAVTQTRRAGGQAWENLCRRPSVKNVIYCCAEIQKVQPSSNAPNLFYLFFHFYQVRQRCSCLASASPVDAQHFYMMSRKTADSSRRDQCPRMCPCQLLFYFNKDLGCVLSFNFPTACVPRPSGITSRFCCIKSKKKPEPAREVYNHHICDDLPSSPFGRRADSRTSWRTTTCRPVVAAV